MWFACRIRVHFIEAPLEPPHSLLEDESPHLQYIGPLHSHLYSRNVDSIETPGKNGRCFQKKTPENHRGHKMTASRSFQRSTCAKASSRSLTIYSVHRYGHVLCLPLLRTCTLSPTSTDMSSVSHRVILPGPCFHSTQELRGGSNFVVGLAPEDWMWSRKLFGVLMPLWIIRRRWYMSVSGGRQRWTWPALRMLISLGPGT